ncbi:hypothetical protein ACJMK2_028325 [Sinanodonta woodiana]|uniref:C-type lectin domain-containing protein n=1 Tax=Sinanodonta woodiana TaxID=1069815 RepID=A0ABD3X6R9_SINWO
MFIIATHWLIITLNNHPTFFFHTDTITFAKRSRCMYVFQCPKNYTKCESEKCGRFCYRYESNQCQSWFDARQICQNEGGDLMVPSECSYQFFREKASLNEGSCSQFWIGGRTENQGFSYVTVKGDVIPQDSRFSYWSIGQPDGLGGENCLEMRMNFNNYLMNNYHCEVKEGFICQFFLK